MWKWCCFALLCCLPCTDSLQRSGGVLKLYIWEYRHPSNTIAGGGDCEVFGGWCDPYFEICISTTDRPRSCDVLKGQTSTFDNRAYLTHSSDGWKLRNPWKAYLNGFTPTKLHVLIQAYDEDSVGKHPLISEWSGERDTPAVYSTFNSETTSPFYLTTRKGQGTMQIKLYISCNENVYGNACDKYCSPQFFSYSCTPEGEKVCRKGKRGPECNSVDHCYHTPCPSFATCLNEDGPGSQNGRMCLCRGGTGPECYPWFCYRNPCQNRGVCNHENHTCRCVPPFYGASCEHMKNLCLESQPCTNGGTCSQRADGSILCHCKPGFSGPRCEATPCSVQPCSNGGTCSYTTESSVLCHCRPGFSGPRCETTPCSSQPCSNGGTCAHKLDASISCTCKPGFSGVRCETTPCSSQPCANNGSCSILQNGRASCRCAPGYEGERCETDLCQRIPCANNGTCLLTMDGQINCTCPLGYQGDRCELSVCNVQPCGNNGTCSVTTDGGVSCECQPGFGGIPCVDVMSVEYSSGLVAADSSSGFRDKRIWTVFLVLLILALCAILLAIILRTRRRWRSTSKLPADRPPIVVLRDEDPVNLYEMSIVSNMQAEYDPYQEVPTATKPHETSHVLAPSADDDLEGHLHEDPVYEECGSIPEMEESEEYRDYQVPRPPARQFV